MASSNEIFNTPTDSRHLTQFIDNLTIDDQRMLARILNNWDDRDQRKQPRTPLSLIHISEPTRPPSTSRMPSSA